MQASKSSISLWCRSIKLSKAQIDKIKNIQEKGRKIGQKKAVLSNIKKNNKKLNVIKKVAKSIISEISNRHEFISGIMLYAVDGTKATKTLEFTNGDSRQILFMYQWFQKYLKINKNNILLFIWLHGGLSKEKAMSFWIKRLNISKNNIKNIYDVKSLGVSKTKYQYGIAKVAVYSTEKLNLTLSLIDTILDQKIVI